VSLESITEELIEALLPMTFSAPVTHTYNPLTYARRPHFRYLERFGRGTREFVLVGMNPGPFGMVQTGVPFGDVAMVRDWLGIEEPVGKPDCEHPKRPVLGFGCPRREVSGSRLWGWAQGQFGSPDAFFARFFVINYCPLAFMEASGRNRTPDKLPAAARDALFAVCDRALAATLASLRPRMVLGIGAFAEERIRSALGADTPAVGRIPHPSPANPAANRGWALAAEEAFRKYGVIL